MKTETANKPTSLTAALANDFHLQCAYTDTLLTITISKLDSQTQFVKSYQALPQKFLILAQTFSDFAQLLTTSKAVQIKQKLLVIEYQIGTKTKNVEIQLNEQEIPLTRQVKNLKKLLQSKTKVIEQNTQQELDLIQQKKKKEQSINQLQKQLAYEKKKFAELNQRVDEFNKKYVKCTKWGCEVAIAIKNTKYHQAGRSGVICGDQCQY